MNPATLVLVTVDEKREVVTLTSSQGAGRGFSTSEQPLPNRFPVVVFSRLVNGETVRFSAPGRARADLEKNLEVIERFLNQLNGIHRTNFTLAYRRRAAIKQGAPDIEEVGLWGG